MTKAQTAVFNHLVAADKELRLAMIRAGNMALRGNVQMHRVTDKIRDAEFELDDAMTLALTATLKIEIPGLDKCKAV